MTTFSIQALELAHITKIFIYRHIPHDKYPSFMDKSSEQECNFRVNYARDNRTHQSSFIAQDFVLYQKMPIQSIQINLCYLYVMYQV